METFRELALTEKQAYNEAISMLEKEYLLNEDIKNIINKASSSVVKIYSFLKEIASLSKYSIEILAEFFKNKQVHEFFKALKFSIKRIGILFRKGVETYNKIEHIISAKIAEIGGVKYIRQKLSELDEFFNSHPVLNRIGGLAVAGLLLYIWLNMSFTPDLEYSMDFSDMLLALGGTFSLSELFASDDGIAMLIYFSTGSLLGISMPWPGGLITHVVGGVIYSLYRLIRTKKVRIPEPEIPGIKKYIKVKI
jgi:hypothetical protein